MAFLCPKCKTANMIPASLEDALQADQCTTCLGSWVTAARYFAYLAAPSDAGARSTTRPESAPDSQGIRLCPVCRKFMHYYAVGHGIPFGIDKCNTCGGVWLDGGEWEDLRAHGLHRQLHAISSDVWQAEVHRQSRIALEEAATARRLGESDYAELLRVAAWLREHAHRAEILSYLQKEGHPPVW